MFGSVVVRLVGQKKVSEDSSALNSITAPEFWMQHPKLSKTLLSLLKLAANVLDTSRLSNSHKQQQTPEADNKESSEAVTQSADKVSPINALPLDLSLTNVLTKYVTCKDINASNRYKKKITNSNVSICPTKSCNNKISNTENYLVSMETYIERSFSSEMELASALVPVLCLLSRLSPGLQIEDKDLRSLSSEFQSVLMSLLSSAVYNIRCLAAKSLVSLTPISEQAVLMETLLTLIHKSDPINTNERNGCLFAVKCCVERSPDGGVSTSFCDWQLVEQRIIRVVTDIQQCYVNRALAVDVLLILNHRTTPVDIPTNEHVITLYPIGFYEFLEKTVRYNLEYFEGTERQELLMKCLNDPAYEVVVVALHFIRDIKYKNVPIDSLIYLLTTKVLIERPDKKTLVFSELLCDIIEEEDTKNSFIRLPALSECLNLSKMLQGKYGSSFLRNGLVIFAYILSRNFESIPLEPSVTFTQKIIEYADENSMEEFRLSSCKAISYLLPKLLACPCRYLNPLKRVIISLCLNLLTDENEEIRRKASVLLVAKLDPKSAIPLHANKTIDLLLLRATELCCSNDDIILLHSIYDCFIPVKKADNREDGVSLFHSVRRNLYKEQHQINLVISNCMSVIRSKGSQIIRNELDTLSQMKNVVYVSSSLNDLLV